ncbi:hypothetical protein LEP1GSC192_3818 [Leptospira sp. B5-022]|nr:hypothetical protein LEP1GSC192_3818 [Leptospira sp. B5-022]
MPNPKGLVFKKFHFLSLSSQFTKGNCKSRLPKYRLSSYEN